MNFSFLKFRSSSSLMPCDMKLLRDNSFFCCYRIPMVDFVNVVYCVSIYSISIMFQFNLWNIASDVRPYIISQVSSHIYPYFVWRYFWSPSHFLFRGGFLFLSKRCKRITYSKQDWNIIMKPNIEIKMRENIKSYLSHL